MRSVEQHQIGRQLGLARIELHRAQIELDAARLLLASTWDNPSPRFTEAVGELEPVAPPPDLETVLGLAEGGPALARWDAELERSNAALALAKSGRVPDVTYGVGVRWEDDIDERDYLVEVQFALPIVDRKQGDIREARYGIARAADARRAAEAATRELVAESYYALAESDARRATLAAEVVPGARAAFEAFRVAFESRPDQVGDLLDARRDLARAEVDYVEALVDCHRARAALEGLIGRGLAAE
jgi:cobalt-zinc-cadmium efflux system outer membrane protein